MQDPLPCVSIRLLLAVVRDTRYSCSRARAYVYEANSKWRAAPACLHSAYTRTRIESSGGSHRESEKGGEREREKKTGKKQRNIECESGRSQSESVSSLSLDFVPAELSRKFCSPDNGLIFAGAVHPGGGGSTRLSSLEQEQEQEHEHAATQHSGSSTRR